MSGERSPFQQIRLLCRLAPATLRKLDAVAHMRRYADGEMIMWEGEEDVPVFFVLEGAVCAFHVNSNGREQTVNQLGPGDAFNLPQAFAGDHRAPLSAVAVGAVRLLAIAGADFRRVVIATPELAAAVLQELSDRLRYLVGLTYDLSLRSVRGRLARFLLMQANSPSPARWTHEQTAAQIGTVREVVSRTMLAFVKEGLVRLERGRIVIADAERLSREAES